MWKNKQIVQEELPRLGWNSENELKRGSAQCRVGGWGLNFHCNLRAWKWQRRNELGLGDRRPALGQQHDKVRKKARAMTWSCRWSVSSGEGKCWCCFSSLSSRVAWPTQRLHFSQKTSSLSGAPFSDQRGNLSSPSGNQGLFCHVQPPGKLNLLKGFRIRPVEQDRKG